MTKFRNLSLYLMIFALLGMSSCENDDSSNNYGTAIVATGTVNDVIKRNGSLVTLRTAIKTASGDMSATLNGSETITLFAPSNAAFDALAIEAGFETSAELLASIDPALLSKILSYHMVAGANGIADLTEGDVLTTAQGDNLTITLSEDEKIQLLDATKLPQTNPVANVTNTNPDVSNGILHFIDKVLLPQEAVEALNIDIRPTILDWGKATPELSLLVSALDKAGLEDTVKGLESTTVLAPTNEAILDLFEELGEDYESLEDFDNEAEINLLADIMKFHVLQGTLDLMAGSTKTALKDNSVEVIAEGGSFAFGDVTDTNASNVSDALNAKNGFVQIIDKLLVPQAAIDFKANLNSHDLIITVASDVHLNSLEEALIATKLDDAFADNTNESFVQGDDESDEDFEKRSSPANYTYFEPATVFAPTDDAFSHLFAIMGDDYTSVASFDTEDELALLKEILLYHVVPGNINKADLMAGNLNTVSGSDLEVIATVGADNFVIGDATNDVNAKIITADVEARNGVAQIIDKVLLPKTAIAFIKSLNDEEGEN